MNVYASIMTGLTEALNDVRGRNSQGYKLLDYGVNEVDEPDIKINVSDTTLCEAKNLTRK